MCKRIICYTYVMKLKEVIVVEGKNDTLKLQRFFDVDTVETHGLGIKEAGLQQLKELHEKRGLILFLDPDSAGNRIRQRINDYIPGVKNAFIDKHKARTNKKVGIEHANQKDLEEALNNVICYGAKLKISLTYEAYVSFGFSGKKNAKALRAYVGNQLFLGECNAKTLYKRLCMFQVDKETLTQIVKEFYEQNYCKSE
ncbi:MAG: ribonuclease M5 [Breznakia sp.]